MYHSAPPPCGVLDEERASAPPQTARGNATAPGRRRPQKIKPFLPGLSTSPRFSIPMKVIRRDAAHPSGRRLVGNFETEACNGARRGSERVYTVRFDQGTGPIDRQAGLSAAVDRRAGSASRRPGFDHRISTHDLRRNRRPNPRSSPAGDFRHHQANRSLRRCPGGAARPEPERRLRARASKASSSTRFPPGRGRPAATSW